MINFTFIMTGETTPYQGDVDYLVDCDPFRTKSPNGYWDKFTQAACSSYALKNINPYDSSKNIGIVYINPKVGGKIK